MNHSLKDILEKENIFLRKGKDKHSIRFKVLYGPILVTGTALVVFFLFYYPEHPINIDSVVKAFAFAFAAGIISYFLVSQILYKRIMNLLIFYVVLILYAISYTLLAYYLLENGYIKYPDFIQPEMLSPHIKLAILCCIAILVFFICRSTFLYFNTYQITNELYQQILKTLESEVNALRLKYNPLLLFNLLSNLNTLIQAEDFEKASRYNSKVTALFSKQLKYATKDYISMEEELNWVNNYLEAERIRDIRYFDYSINISNDELLLQFNPPLLIQPLVEWFIIQNFQTNPPAQPHLINIHITEHGAQGICITIHYDKNITKYQQIQPVSIITLERRIQLINKIRKFYIELKKSTENNLIKYELYITNITEITEHLTHV